MNSTNENVSETTSRQRWRTCRTWLVGILKSLGIGFIWVLIVYLVVFPSSPLRRELFDRGCVSNLKRLRKALVVYSYDFMSYPKAGEWCDLLLRNDAPPPNRLLDENVFICDRALAKGDQGRCHYAINPNCNPNAPGGTVLLFETKGGWNQYGGPEIMALENHKKRGCWILFNDGRVEFIAADRIEKLNWR